MGSGKPLNILVLRLCSSDLCREVKVLEVEVGRPGGRWGDPRER